MSRLKKSTLPFLKSEGATARMYSVLLVFAGMGCARIASADIISTIAGTGTASYNGDGIAATTANLNNPSSVAVDLSGNVYIADFANQRIRKVTAATGTITTIAGTGSYGYGGDGSAATTALFSYPTGIAVDSSGNVYIVDQGNVRIRKVTAATGIISTIAGTGTSGYNGDGIAATTAQLFYPNGIALDAAGNIYIADEDNQRIRKVTVSSGLISTIAGTGTPGYNGDGIAATAAKISYPTGVALDSTGNIYIVDKNNNSIRKVTVATGMISTIAGSAATYGYNGDGIVATSALLWNPYGVAVDSNGNVLIVDQYNNRVRKVTIATGLISTIAGTSGGAGYNGDGIPATSAQLYNPYDVDVDGGGNVFIADFTSNRIRKITPPYGDLVSTLLLVSPHQSATGQTVSVVLNVSCTGTGAVNNVVPTIQVVSGVPLVSLASGPTPASVSSLAAGTGITFTWTYNTSTVFIGPASFTASATGTDAASGNFRFTSVVGDSVSITGSAVISAALAVSPAVSSTGQTVTVRLTVTNSGFVAASNVSPTIQMVSGGSLATLTTGPVPVNISSLAAGSSTTFVWTYSTSTVFSGRVRFSATATAVDVSSGGPLLATAFGDMTVLGLEAMLSVNPATILSGQTVSVQLTVTNNGSSTANNVAPEMQAVSGGSFVTLVAGPVPANVSSLTVGSSTTFVWTYMAPFGSDGFVGFSATVTGSDAVTGGPRSANAMGGLSIVPAVPAPPQIDVIGKELGRGHFRVCPNVIDRSNSSVQTIIVANGNPDEEVAFTIFDELGREVRKMTLTVDPSGIGKKIFDVKNDAGASLLDGMYYIIGKGGGVNDKQKIVIVPLRKR